MQWIFENRKILPGLISRERIVPDLANEPPFNPLSDGLHVVAHRLLIDGWEEALHIPVTVYSTIDPPPSLALLMRLTGANCFLYLGGLCEAELSVGLQASNSQMAADRALVLLKSVLPPDSDSST